MAEQERVETLITPDELVLLRILREFGPDADFEVNKRDGKIVNTRSTVVHAKRFTVTNRLQEARGGA